MAILVTGSTGRIGSLVVQQLAARGADVLALVRNPEQANFPAGVTVVKGDLTDVDSMRAALSTARTLFLLNAVTPDEVTQALIALNLAREAGIERVVYFSVMHADLYSNVPHFTGKHTVERMIEQSGIPATILRPAYFMQNDLQRMDVIAGHGVYPMPIGAKGLAMIDMRDIADVAVLELLRRDASPVALPAVTIDLVGPELRTGAANAHAWSEAQGRPVAYGGDDIQAFVQVIRQFAPGWMAYDMGLMLARFQTDGMVPAKGDVAKLEQMLGRPLRTYGKMVQEAVAQQ